MADPTAEQYWTNLNAQLNTAGGGSAKSVPRQRRNVLSMSSNFQTTRSPSNLMERALDVETTFPVRNRQEGHTKRGRKNEEIMSYDEMIRRCRHILITANEPIKLATLGARLSARDRVELKMRGGLKKFLQTFPRFFRINQLFVAVAPGTGNSCGAHAGPCGAVKLSGLDRDGSKATRTEVTDESDTGTSGKEENIHPDSEKSFEVSDEEEDLQTSQTIRDEEVLTRSTPNLKYRRTWLPPPKRDNKPPRRAAPPLQSPPPESPLRAEAVRAWLRSKIIIGPSGEQALDFSFLDDKSERAILPRILAGEAGDAGQHMSQPVLIGFAEQQWTRCTRPALIKQGCGVAAGLATLVLSSMPGILAGFPQLILTLLLAVVCLRYFGERADNFTKLVLAFFSAATSLSAPSLIWDNPLDEATRRHVSAVAVGALWCASVRLAAVLPLTGPSTGKLIIAAQTSASTLLIVATSLIVGGLGVLTIGLVLGQTISASSFPHFMSALGYLDVDGVRYVPLHTGIALGLIAALLLMAAGSLVSQTTAKKGRRTSLQEYRLRHLQFALRFM